MEAPFHEPQRAAAPLAGSSDSIRLCRRDARQHVPVAVHGPDARPKLEVEASHEPEASKPKFPGNFSSFAPAHLLGKRL